MATNVNEPALREPAPREPAHKEPAPGILHSDWLTEQWPVPEPGPQKLIYREPGYTQHKQLRVVRVFASEKVIATSCFFCS
jgi:hypothetical protein